MIAENRAIVDPAASAAELLTAACEIIPKPEASGDYPQGPTWPTHGGLLGY